MSFTLKKIKIDKTKWIELITKLGKYAVPVTKEEFHIACNGYSNSAWVYYYENCMICSALDLKDIGIKVDFKYDLSNYQYVVECGQEGDKLDESISIDLQGKHIYSIMMKKIKTKYSKDEIEERLSLFEADYNPTKIQRHDNFPYTGEDVVVKIPHTYYYDINSAYGYYLTKIFPKCEKIFENIYANRKKKPVYKNYFNYFIGYFCVIGHRKTFNYIVQHVRDQIDELINKCEGLLVYANTDGFFISNPKHLIETKIGLGNIKCEYEDKDCYQYYGNNYCLYQIEDHQVGNCLKEVRHLIDLSKGEVVEYKRQRIKETNIYTTDKIINKKVGIKVWQE